MKTLSLAAIGFGSILGTMGLSACGQDIWVFADGGGSDAAVLDDAMGMDATDAATQDGPVFGGGDTGVIDAGTGCHLATLGTPGPYPSDVFSTWLDQTDTAVASLLDQVLTPALLSPYKMIVSLDISQNHQYSPQEVAALEGWVQGGGGLMTVTGYRGAPEPINVNRLLAPYGMSYDSTLVLNCGPAPATCPIYQWVSHPITTGITNIGFGNGFAVLGSGTMLASSQGYNVLEAKNVGSGHVVLWGDEWITLDENWLAHPEYQMKQFWQNIVDWFNPTGNCVVPDPK